MSCYDSQDHPIDELNSTIIQQAIMLVAEKKKNVALETQVADFKRTVAGAEHTINEELKPLNVGHWSCGLSSDLRILIDYYKKKGTMLDASDDGYTPSCSTCGGWDIPQHLRRRANVTSDCTISKW